MLIDDFATDCKLVTKTLTPDGAGGHTVVWVEGSSTFKAAITFDSSMQARIAEKQGVTSKYTITFPKSIALNFNDVLKRVSDGKYFRCTSDCDDLQTPSVASFSFAQVTAEEFKLT